MTQPIEVRLTTKHIRENACSRAGPAYYTTCLPVEMGRVLWQGEMPISLIKTEALVAKCLGHVQSLPSHTSDGFLRMVPSQGHVLLAFVEDSRNIWRGGRHRQVVDYKPLMCRAPEVGLTSMLRALGGMSTTRPAEGTERWDCLALPQLRDSAWRTSHASWSSMQPA